MTSKFEIAIDQYDDMYLYRGGREIGWASPHNDAGRSALKAVIDMQDKIARLEARNAELLVALDGMIELSDYACMSADFQQGGYMRAGWLELFNRVWPIVEAAIAKAGAD